MSWGWPIVSSARPPRAPPSCSARITCIPCPTALAFFIGPPLFVFVAGESYRSASAIVGWIALGQGLSGMYLMVTNYVFYSRRTGILAVTTMLSAVIGLGALFILIDRFGLLGAAYAYCIGMGARFVLTWIAAHLRHPMPWISSIAIGDARLGPSSQASARIRGSNEPYP